MEPHSGGQGSERRALRSRCATCTPSTASAYDLNEGESLGIVGESGCGKSVSVLSVMRLIPQPPGEIDERRGLFQGRDLLKLSTGEMRAGPRQTRSRMIFQDPMTSLNPVLTIGRQITEALELHLGMDTKQAPARAAELLEMVGIPAARRPPGRLSRTSSPAACASA